MAPIWNQTFNNSRNEEELEESKDTKKKNWSKIKSIYPSTCDGWTSTYKHQMKNWEVNHGNLADVEEICRLNEKSEDNQMKELETKNSKLTTTIDIIKEARLFYTKLNKNEPLAEDVKERILSNFKKDIPGNDC